MSALYKELKIRARVEGVFNKREEDFPDAEAYNNYLEEREDIIFNLTEGIDVDEAEAKLLAYQRDNRENILANQIKQAEDVRQQAEASSGAANLSAATSSAAPPGAAALFGPSTGTLPAAAFPQQPVPEIGLEAAEAALKEREEAIAAAGPELRVALASGWTPELPKQRALYDAFGSIFAY